MLTDNEIVALKKNVLYKKVTKLGLKEFTHDIISSGNGDFNPDLSNILKFANTLFRARKIRNELYVVTKEYLEIFLNRNLKNFGKSIINIKNICSSPAKKYSWMRYDVERVTALFDRCSQLLTTPEFRELIKYHSTLSLDKDDRIIALLNEIETIKSKVIVSIRTRGIFDDLFDLQKDEYYKANEDKISNKFLENIKRGYLGSLDEINDNPISDSKHKRISEKSPMNNLGEVMEKLPENKDESNTDGGQDARKSN
jgi:hypothetical protein